MSAPWPSPEAGDTLARLAVWQWWLRLGVFLYATVVLLTLRGSHVAAAVAIAVAALALGAWWVGDRAAPPRAVLRLAGLASLTVVGGLVAGAHAETSVLAPAMMAMVAVGVELALGEVIAIFLAGVLAIEVGALLGGHADIGTVVGYPALLAGLGLLGRYRRVYRVQAEQAQALLAETRRAQREAERVAALTERSRIAREIHDVLAHSLSALAIQLQATEALLAERGDVARALQSLAGARRLVDEGVIETQRAVRALRSDAPPLPEALAALVQGRPDALTVVGEPYAVSPAAGLALLRVAQEAVTNAVKHAPGHPAALVLRYAADGVSLRVDNALPDAGGAPVAEGASGFGLAGMHERLRLIDGELRAGPVGERWIVEARVTR